ncbi:MAG: hypothetical protein JO321_11180 [Solirubrobacterales bacterium]|nr:hypothetical protein [Solirubrobacterales bacterium]
MSFGPMQNPAPPPYVPTPRGPDRGRLAQARALEGTATFAVSATFMGSGRRGQQKRRKGELFISPDAVAFTSRDLGQPARFDHSEGDITMVKGRLCPPWANTFLFLQDRDSTVRIAASMSARRGLRRALGGAGVTVHEQSSSRAPEPPRRGGRRT